MHQIARGIAIAGSVFTLTICVMMIIGVTQSRVADPVDMPEMVKLREALKDNPGDDQLREQVRMLDTVVRRAYFASLTFTRTGAALLLAGVIVTLAALKVISVASVKVTVPGASPPGAGEVLAGRSRMAIAVAGIAVLVAAAGLFLMRSRFNEVSSADKETSQPTDKATGLPSRGDFLKNWPSFRGPDGLAIAHTTNSPTKWNGETGDNILWKTSIPKHGFNSPVVWGDLVFLTGADEESRELYCFNADSGKLLWRHVAEGIPGSPSELPEVMEDTGFAAATVATDGRSVYAIFATGDIVATDFDGARKWARNLGVPKNPYGHSSSLITHGGRVFVQYDQEDKQQLVAIDSSSGETAWTAKRDVHPSWASPVIAVREDGADIILNAQPIVAAYDVLNGEVKWTMDCMSGEVAPSPAYLDGVVYVTTEYAVLAAIKPGKPARILWETDEELPDISSPLAVEGLLIMGTTSGVITCHDASDGKQLWLQEFDDGFNASAVFSSGNVYLMDKAGIMHIFKAAPEYTEVSRCSLGEESVCTAAFVGQRIFVRGMRNLYCIGPDPEH